MRPNRLWSLGWPIYYFLVCGMVVLTANFICPSLQAQEVLHFQPLGRSNQQQAPLPGGEGQPAPPVISGAPSPAPGPKTNLGPGLHVFVKKIIVTGSTVFSKEEIAKVTKPYLNREVNSEDLEQLRRALTLLYVRKGYVNSGAVLPDQTIVNGTITFKIIEGTLNGITVEGNKWLNSSYYSSRLALGAGPPLNVNKLEKRLLLLQQDDRVKQIHAQLRPGIRPGESDLNLQVQEQLPFSVVVGFNNYQSPSVGAERGIVNLTDKSLTGRGDVLSVAYAGSQGADPEIDTSYSIPFTPEDTTLILHYGQNTYHVVEDPFEDLNIKTKSDIFGIGFRQPVYRSLNQELALSLTGEHLEDESSLLGEPFSFSPGEQNGKSTVTALRFGQEWLYRTQRLVLAARSRFSLGIDAFGATTNPAPLPDSHFFVWLGQFQWAQLIGSWGVQSIFRADIQLADRSLLPLEQIPVGGRYSVRGYRENEFVRDNAVIVSLETRFPVVRHTRWADYLQLAPFIDYGKAWNTTLPTPPKDYLFSVGIGLRWGLTVIAHPFPIRPEFEVYWGIPLEKVRTGGSNLQDSGICLQFAVVMF